MLPIAAEIAVRLTREQAQSALPNAPVIPLEETRPPASLLSRVLAVARRGPTVGASRQGPSPSRATPGELFIR